MIRKLLNGDINRVADIWLKTRLTSMLRSGKELKVFTVKSGDLKKFTQEAKKYGVLYCVLTDRKNKDPNAEVDVIARAEDASKISRIVERFNLASVDTASIVTEAEKSKDAKDGQPEPDIGVQEKAEKGKINLKAHYFISDQYWKSNYELVKEMMSQYEVYVFEADKMIQGFVGLNDKYIEGIFVSDEMQSCGIGKLLLV